MTHSGPPLPNFAFTLCVDPSLSKHQAVVLHTFALQLTSSPQICLCWALLPPCTASVLPGLHHVFHMESAVQMSSLA